MSEQKTVKKEVASTPKDNKKTVQSKDKKEMIAVVRVRGSINVNTEIVDTLNMLHLGKKNSCIVFVPTDSAMGMIRKAKDYITWGEISEETLALLTDKRKAKNKSFHLNPPKKGFGRKGVKVPFSKGGALGYRKDKMNDLITRML